MKKKKEGYLTGDTGEKVIFVSLNTGKKGYLIGDTGEREYLTRDTGENGIMGYLTGNTGEKKSYLTKN